MASEVLAARPASFSRRGSGTALPAAAEFHLGHIIRQLSLLEARDKRFLRTRCRRVTVETRHQLSSQTQFHVARIRAFTRLALPLFNGAHVFG